MNLNATILKRFAKELYLDKVFPSIREGKAKQFITLTLTLITVIFFGIFAINPTIVTIVNLNKQLADSQLVYTQLQQKITNLSQLQISYTAIQDEIPLVNAAMPMAPQAAETIAKIQTIATSQHMSVIRMETASPLAPLAKTTTSASFSFSLIVQGNQQDLFTFMHRLSNFDRLITIDKVTSTNALLSGQLQLSLEGKAYYKID